MAVPLAIAAIGSSVAAGVTSAVSARKQGQALEKQGDIQAQEALRTAKINDENNRKFRARQKLAFLKNGVSLEGSPLLVLQESADIGREQSGAIRARGAAQKSLARTNASTARAQGRASLIGGLGQGASQFAQFKLDGIL